MTMCLAKVYINDWSEKPVLQDIAHVRIKSGMIELEELLGEEKVLKGRIDEMDFATSKILLVES